MSDLLGVTEAIKCIELIYNDAFSPSAKEVGKTLKDVFRALRLLSLPFQGLSFLQSKVDHFLEKSIAPVKEENLVLPPGHVLLKIYQEIQVYNLQTLHMDLFSNLLSSFINKEKLAYAHPAFIILIPQLCDDEIKILKHLKEKNYELEEYSHFDNASHRFTKHEVRRNELPVDNFSYPNNVFMYISHLYSLNLACVWQQGVQEPDIKGGLQVGSKKISWYRLTEFGSLFAQACLS